MKHGSLFSGIGGFDLAAQWMGWENVFHCEWNEFGQKVLKHYWPKAISYHDITKTDFTIHRGRIDVLTGGFPCQPYSLAGQRKGKEDERHLWPEMLRAIREIQPTWVVGENVFGLVNWNGGLVFEEVQADLEAQGYEVQPYVFPAAAVNAPHRRDRVWFVAYSDKCTTRPSRTSGEVESNGSKNNDEQSIRRKQTEQHNRCSDVLRVDTDTTGEGLERRLRKSAQGRSNGLAYNGKNGNATNSNCKRLERECWSFSKLEREIGFSGSGSRNMSGATWQDFPTQSPICGGDDGLPRELDGITFPKWRNESIKAYGNAVVPQVVYQIFKAIELYENDPIN